MLIAYGAGVAGMSGSSGGVTASRNRHGPYFRNRTTPVNPRSARQMAIRAIMMYLAEQWREPDISEANRVAWNDYAPTVNWSNKLGGATTLTGQNMFVRGNIVKLQCGSPIILAGPVVAGLPAGDPAFDIDTLSAAAQSCSIIFDDTFDWCDEATGHLSIAMGKPQPQSHNFFNGPWKWWVQSEGDVGSPPASPLAGISGLPWVVTEGQKVWFKARILRADGRVTTEFQCDPVIVAA